MNFAGSSREDENVQRLLDEIRRTLNDNQQFIKRLREDDQEPLNEPESAIDTTQDNNEEDFEEL